MKKSTGNMYDFVSHTHNPIKGFCPYDCSYCYMKKWGKNTKPLHIDETELKTNLGSNNFIFICSGCDLFHPQVPDKWIAKVVHHARQYPNNKYLLQTKNPGRILELSSPFLASFVICVTVESNRYYPQYMGEASEPEARLSCLASITNKKMITIEPVMDFDWKEFSEQIIKCKPFQVNIGANSNYSKPFSPSAEPSRDKLSMLIDALEPHTKVHLKKNLRRLLPEHRLYESKKLSKRLDEGGER